MIAARNRHTVTPQGWAHEEHNRKLVLAADGSVSEVLVHEEGFNTYRPDTDLALGIAYAYWEGTAAFWSEVRAAWGEVLSAHSAYRIEGWRTTNAFSALADEYLEGSWRDDAERRVPRAPEPDAPAHDAQDQEPVERDKADVHHREDAHFLLEGLARGLDGVLRVGQFAVVMGEHLDRVDVRVGVHDAPRHRAPRVRRGL